MPTFAMQTFACIILSLLMAANSEGSDGDVLVLNEGNFDSEVARLTKDDAALMVEFYTPWCGHCKVLEPKYKTAATKLMHRDKPIRIAKVDGSNPQNQRLLSKHDVTAYPTIKVFKSGGRAVFDYDGPREVEALVDHVLASQGPLVQEVGSEAQVRDIIAASQRVALYVGEEPRDDSLPWKAYKSAASEMKPDFVMLATFETAVGTAFNVKAPALVLFASYAHEVKNSVGHEKERVELLPPEALMQGSQIGMEKRIVSFLFRRGVPLVSILSDSSSNPKLLAKAGLPVLYVVVPAYDFTRRDMYRKRLSKVAPTYRDRILFAVASSKELEGQQIMKQFGLSEQSLPALLVRNPDEVSKFLFNKTEFTDTTFNFKLAIIKDFVKAYLANNLVKYLKSEPAPTEELSDENPVQVVVGSTFDSIVLDKSKNVLLNLYHPTCHSSKDLEPDYKEVALEIRKLAFSNPERYGNLVIAKMDIIANDSPHPAVQAQIYKGSALYPTLKFISAGSNKVIDFPATTGKSKADILNWIKKTSAQYS